MAAHDEFGTDPAYVDLWADFEPSPLSPALLARRSRLRRLVGFIVAMLSVFTIFAFARSDPPWRNWDEMKLFPEKPLSEKEQSAAIPPAPEAHQDPPRVHRTQVAGAYQPEPPLLLGLELPDSLPEHAREQFRKVNLAREVGEFEKADAVLEKLCTARDEAVRDRARLVRALMWVEEGRASLVRSVFEDLRSHSQIASVRARARQYLADSHPSLELTQ